MISLVDLFDIIQLSTVMKEDDELTAANQSMSVLIEISGDEDLDAYFKKHEVKLNELKCPKEHLIEKICTNEDCDSSALHCLVKDCSACF